MQKTPDGIRRQAVFDPAGRYRYSLRRRWDAAGARVAFVLLNPSTADGRRDDPTIRRCIGFAREWGFGGLEVVNLFACRSTHPGGLRSAQDPVGPENDRFLAAAWDRADRVIVAWGNHGALLGGRGGCWNWPAAAKSGCKASA